MADPRTLLRARGLRAKKSFGQNFLVSEHVARTIAEACVPDEEVGRARVVEIGAGTGALTLPLLSRARSVVAVERDRDLIPLLETELGAWLAEGKLILVEDDAQTVPLGEHLGAEPPRVLTGNLPYQLTGRLLRRTVELARHLERVVVMVQAEVRDRILAEPGTKDYGALTVFVGAAFRPSHVLAVGPGSFHPPPEVSSAVVRLEPRDDAVDETPLFRELVMRAFGARRKTLRNAWSGLGAGKALAAAAERAGISLAARGETLSVGDFARMATELASSGFGRSFTREDAAGRSPR
jgi:16S rRNA (adenine1518-N6/adenine1519-N6)-dimethyltransferase